MLGEAIFPLARCCSAPEALFPTASCCSAPPQLHRLTKPPLARSVPSPGRLSPSPVARRLSPSPQAARSMPALPAMPRVCPETVEANETTPSSACAPSAAASPSAPSGLRSPSLIERLQMEGLWPPPLTDDALLSPTSGAASSAASGALPDASPTSGAADSSTSGALPDASPTSGTACSASSYNSVTEDPRLREAQRLLAQMLTGAAGGGREGDVRIKRRRSSAPPLGSRIHNAASAAEAEHCGGFSPAPGFASRERSPGKGSGGTAFRREATAPPLKPINGSMPHFPTPDSKSDPGTLRGGPRK